jgi:hypothetical protein
MALERLHTKIYHLFVRVPYPAWVKVACGIIPDEVLDLQVETRAIYGTLQTYIRRHPGKMEGSRVIKQVVSQYPPILNQILKFSRNEFRLLTFSHVHERVICQR